jgi:predicted amidohydrolase
MKIAAAAYPLDWHNRWNDYVGKLRVWVRTATEQKAELLVFPAYGAMELASLAGEDIARDPERSIEAVNARIKDVDELHGSLAREFKVYICAASGPIKRPDDRKPVNRARLFSPDGSHGVQDKLTMTQSERDAWGIAGGGPARVFDTGLGKIGILIGGDAGFPAVARAMAAAGAEVLLVPSCSESLQGYWRVRIAAQARALENQCIVAHATTVGTADWLAIAATNHGAAGLYGPPDAGFPEDGVVAVGKPDAAGWVHGEVSMEALRQARTDGAGWASGDWTDQLPRGAEVETVTLGSPADS